MLGVFQRAKHVSFRPARAWDTLSPGYLFQVNIPYGGWRNLSSLRRSGQPTFAVLVLQRWDILVLGVGFEFVFAAPLARHTAIPQYPKNLQITIDKLHG